MEKINENIGKKKEELLSREITIEAMKNALEVLNKQSQFKDLQKIFSELISEREVYEESRKEINKGGDMSIPVTIKGEKECLEKIEKIESIMFSMVIDQMGINSKDNIHEFIEDGFGSIFKKPGDTEKSDLSGVMTTEGFETPFKK
jgi:hypothetical protein